MTTAIVVGSGPNGLAAAVKLARAGVSVTVLEAADHIGGGTRSSQQIVPGLIHDHCSAVHPLGQGSPFLSSIAADLERHGLRWKQPDIDCAHPLDDGSAGLLYRSMTATVDALGSDGARWRRLFGPLADRFEPIFADASQPFIRVPRHPVPFVRFGIGALLPAALLARALRTQQAKALWGGIAAHTYHPLNRPFTSAAGLMLTIAAHAQGWVVAEGGSQSIADALAADLRAHGGVLETGRRVVSVADLHHMIC